jgi:hypothetical protein
MRKLSKTLLSLLLIAAMLASFVVLPAAAEEPAAEQPTEAVQAAETQAADDTSYRYNIVHVDAGRKYFSPTSIKAIIDNAAEAGFNQVELYLSDNQGFRFALDDMTVTTSTGNTYDLSAALGDGYTASDGKCPDGSDKYLTQSEMTDIIAYAKSKNVEIVPCVNAPGHMGAILEEFSDFRYTSGWQTSKSSIDLGNAEAVAFALAITDKYAKYFASQGCKYYNIGADEYANDLSSMGFENMGSALYTKFVEFMNSAADIIVGYGMTPRAFNDGFCYNKNEYNSVTVAPSKAYEICYWSSGWGGYNVAPASTLSSNGYKLINTNGDYYWVLGNSGWQCSANKASGFDYTNFSGNTKISSPSGSMFCIWCDFGNTNGADGGTQVVSDTADVIAAFGKALPTVRNNTATDENKTVFDSSFPEISVTGPNLTKVTVTETDAPANLPTGVTAAKAWDIVPYVGEDEYHDTAKVTLPIPTEWTGADVYGGVIENGEVKPIKDVELDEEADTLTFTVPHFSTVMVLEAEKTVDITLALGEVFSPDPLPGNVTPIDETGLDKNVATVSAEYTKTEARTDYVAVDDLDGSDAQTKGVYIGDGTNWLVVNGSNISSTTDKTKATLFTVGGKTNAYSLNVTGTNYNLRVRDSNNTVKLHPSNQNSNYTDWCYTSAKSGFTYQFTYTVLFWQKTASGALTYNNGWEATENATVGAKAYTKKTIPAADKTVLTFTGVAAGTTSVKIGNIRYNITVVPEDVKNVSPLTIEYWITNRYVSEGTTYNDAQKTMSLSATTAYKPEGVVLAEIVPATGTIEGGATGVYWKSRQLPSTDKQTHTSGVDKTTVTTGTDITRVRYWGKAWQYSSDDGKTWKTFESTDQVVAYYLQKTTVTDEIQTEVVDWGEVPHTWYNSTNFVLVDYAVKYQSGELNPNTFAQDGKTLAFHCNYNTDLNKTVFKYSDATGNSATNYYRKIGMIRATNTADYEVYMITLTPSSDSRTTTVANNSNSAKTYTYAGTEKVVWVDDEANLGKFEDASLHADGYHVGGEATVPGLEITNRHAMLVTYYIRAVETEDSLIVRYVDETSSPEVEFYNYPITVKAETVFDENIKLPETKIDGITSLTNGRVENSLQKYQYVSSVLSTMPEISTAYQFGNYECTRVVRSEDGKTVTLYYKFNNNHYFVADFGLPLHISSSDIGIQTQGWEKASAAGAQYGTTQISVGGGLTYTPTSVMKERERITVKLSKVNSEGKTEGVDHVIYIIPASTVYYEEGFATYEGTWATETNKGTVNQTLTKLGDGKYTENGYGYDDAYKNDSTNSNATTAVTTAVGSSATFQFKGTGLELYLRTKNTNNTTDPTNEAANSVDGHSYMLVQVYQGTSAATENLKRMSFVDVNNLFVQKDTQYGYNTPCWTVDGMVDGEYTVVVRFVKGETLAIDGFRVTNKAYESSYAQDNEAQMDTAEIRNMVIANAQTNLSFDAYSNANEMYRVATNKVLDAVFNETDTITGAVILTDDSNGTDTVTVDKELLNIGPKNEIYLKNGQAAVMQIPTTYTTVQVGMRSLTGDTVTYKINGTSATMNSTVDMYYKVVPVEGKLVIQNVSGGILALTRLKVTSATAATGNDSGVIPETTPEAIRYAMALVRGIDVPQFTDVPEGAWYHDYVYDLVYRGVVNGMTATTYEPEGKLTRAQFVKLLACSLADAETLKTYEGKHPFKDSEGHWAEAYIAWAKDKGIVEGVSATEFDPEAPITREQMATIFGRYALKQGIELPKDAAPAESFPDADKISEYAREFVELMRIAGILNGYEDGTFRPQGNATRAEAAKLFSLFLSITDKLAK